MHTAATTSRSKIMLPTTTTLACAAQKPPLTYAILGDVPLDRFSGSAPRIRSASFLSIVKSRSHFRTPTYGAASSLHDRKVGGALFQA